MQDDDTRDNNDEQQPEPADDQPAPTSGGPLMILSPPPDPMTERVARHGAHRRKAEREAKKQLEAQRADSQRHREGPSEGLTQDIEAARDKFIASGIIHLEDAV